MFILHCIPISAMNRLLFHSACTDENHMLNEGPSSTIHLRHSDQTALLLLLPSHIVQMVQRARTAWKRLALEA